MESGKWKITMITIIHGTDIAASRKYFLDLKEKEKDALLINGQTLSLTDMVQYFDGGELFSTPKSFFIEQLLSKKKKSKELEQIITQINKYAQENIIYIWEEKDLTPANLNSFKNSQVKQFKLPQTLFLFVESIKPGNGVELIKLFHKSIETSDAEMVFFMMVRQIRLLLGVIEPGTDAIDEVKRMAPWLRGKLERQADLFEIGELRRLYAKLFELEKGLKTGSLPMPLIQAIDFLLLGI